jgi:hypothetical protein
MNNSTYYLVYQPNLKEHSKPNIICKDNTIHIRLKNYVRPEVISGTINKLTYLLCYLLNYCYLPTTLLDKSDIEAIFNGFLKSEDVISIKTKLCYSITLTKVYSRKYNMPFGLLQPNICPVKANNNGESKCSLNCFLDTFNVTLDDYLFNDGIEIHINNRNTHKNIEKAYTKFHNKTIRYKKKQNKEYINTNLW